MPRQVYRCRIHGEFEVIIPIKDDVPPFVFCPVDIATKGETSWRCLCRCDWVPSAPNFIGGPTTGAGKE
ncbi:hypothetical protein LCGC14_1996490 [marine sediment metagenome]|uniref:Uncharacterized protein n=1 Tax=marine sediment metagenome TaxID=412755 RepID=A0A0F9HHZ7_9ZZZZ